MKRVLIVMAFVLAASAFGATSFMTAGNFGSGVLNTTIDASATTVVLESGDGMNFPSTFSYPIVIDDEIMLVTGKTGDTLTVTRGAESTLAVGHTAAAAVEQALTAKYISDVSTAVNALENSSVALTALDTEAEVEAVVADTTDILTSNDSAYSFLITAAGTSGQLWQSDGTGAGSWATLLMALADSESEAEAALLDVTDVFTDNDTEYDFLIGTAGTDGQVWTSDGTGAGVWETSAMGGVDTEGELESALTDVYDLLSSSDTYYGYLINSVGTAGYVWTSDGAGRGDWSASAAGNDDMGAVDTEAELETALTDVTNVLTDTDTDYTYLITSAGTSGQTWTSDGSGKGVWATPASGTFIASEADLEAALADVVDAFTNNDTEYPFLIDSAGTSGQLWQSDGTNEGQWATLLMAVADTEAEAEAAMADATDILTDNDAEYAYLITSAGASGQFWQSDGTGAGVWATPGTADAIASEADLETALADTTDVLTSNDTEYPFLIGTAGTDGFVWTSTGSAGNWEAVSSATTTRSITLLASGATYPDANFPALSQEETTTNGLPYWVLAFDAATDETCYWVGFQVPEDYASGDFTAHVKWTAASGSGDVVWNVGIYCYGDSDAIDQSITMYSATDTLITAGDVHISPDATLTTAGTVAAGNYVIAKAFRDADNAADTFSADAQLLSVTLEYTGN